MNYRINTAATTWRDRMAQINAAKKEYGEYYSIMTRYERVTAEREIVQSKHSRSKPLPKACCMIMKSRLID